MQHYSDGFANVYDRYFAKFSGELAGSIGAFYEDVRTDLRTDFAIDLFCGTGIITRELLQRGARVFASDLSPGMLQKARERCSEHTANNRAIFAVQDARALEAPESAGFITACDDAINHLADLGELQQCFSSAWNAAGENCYFIFDLNTKAGLRLINGDYMRDADDHAILWRAIYDPDNFRSLVRIAGFSMDGVAKQWIRFEQTFYDYGYDLSDVQIALETAGWTDIRFTSTKDLSTALDNPEAEQTVVAIARK